MPIGEFDGLDRRPLHAAFDKASGWDGWDMAQPCEGRIELGCRFVMSSPYDTEALERLTQALQNDEIFVEALDPQTHEWRRLPPGFWLGNYLLKTYGPGRDAWSLQAFDIVYAARPIGPAYLHPRLVIPATLPDDPRKAAWQIAKDLLDRGLAPPHGRGRPTNLARMVVTVFQRHGRQAKLDTVGRHIAQDLKDWEREHPGR